MEENNPLSTPPVPQPPVSPSTNKLIWVLGTLMLFPLVGLILMWLFMKDWPKKAKMTVTLIYVGLILLLILSQLFFMFLFWQSFSKQPVSYDKEYPTFSTPIPNLMSDWKTYTNTKNEFSIKYPTNQQVIINDKDYGSSTGYSTNNSGEGNILIYPQNYSIPQNETHFTDELAILFFVLPNEKSLTAKEWMKENQTDLWNQISETEYVTLDGAEGIKFFPTYGMSEQEHVVFTKDKKIYVIVASGTEKTLTGTFDQMLSTFKFTNVTTSNAQTNACDEIKNVRFASVEQQTGGTTPEGAGKTHWTIQFADTTFSWMYTDIVQAGFFTCENNKITLKDSAIVGIYDPTTQILLWDGVPYTKDNAN